MKNIIRTIGLFLALGLVLYLYRDVFIGKKVICNNINISKNYYNYISKNNLLESICYYSKEVKKGNFFYLDSIAYIDNNVTKSLDKQKILVELIVDSDKDKLKKYFNNISTSRQSRLLIYISLKTSDEKNAKNILQKLKPINNGNDFIFK